MDLHESPARAAGQPVVPVDTRKKELIGTCRNGGSDYRHKGEPRQPCVMLDLVQAGFPAPD